MSESTQSDKPKQIGEPGYIDQLVKKQEELRETERRLDEKKAAIDRDVTTLMMGGKSPINIAPPEKTESEKLVESTNKLFEKTGLNPFKGAGAKAL